MKLPIPISLFIQKVKQRKLYPYLARERSHTIGKQPTFKNPSRDNLVIYELLIRDFDLLHSFDAVKARLDYLQNLGINAIELLPVSEFDGNESWGYNPSFHMALDKYYGTTNAFKSLIDECHSRGIAVILDVVYNHASGQHPYFRLWNDSNGGLEGNPPLKIHFSILKQNTPTVFLMISIINQRPLKIMLNVL